MKLLSTSVLLLTLLSTNAFAEKLPDELYTPTEGGEYITISVKPCPNEAIKKEFFYYAYVEDNQGVLHEGCWNRFEPPVKGMTSLVVIKYFTDNVTMSLGQYYFSPIKNFKANVADE